VGYCPRNLLFARLTNPYIRFITVGIDYIIRLSSVKNARL
jgi:hypothetical protein